MVLFFAYQKNLFSGCSEKGAWGKRFQSSAIPHRSPPSYLFLKIIGTSYSLLISILCINFVYILLQLVPFAFYPENAVDMLRPL
jgi:hypothetical protein